MNENPQPSTVPPTPPRRLGRTAVAVHLLALLAGGLFFLAAYFQKDLSAREVFNAFGFSLSFVGLNWSVVLAVRAGLREESLLLPLFMPLLVGWELSVPFLLLWHDPQRGFDTNWYFLHYICAPLWFPLATVSATIAVPFFLLLRTVFKRTGSEAIRARRRSAIAAIALGLILFFGTLPFGFVLYGGSMSYRQFSNARPRIWTVSAVDAVPVVIRDAAFKFALLLPEKVRGRIPNALANYGLLSVELYISELSTSGPDLLKIEDDFRSGFIVYFSDNALNLARERLNQPYTRTALNDVLVKQYASRASPEEIRELFSERKKQLNKSGTIGDLAFLNIRNRGDIADFADDVYAMRETSPEMVWWRINTLFRIGNDDYLRDAYLQLFQSKLSPEQIIAINGMLRDKRKFSVILAALEHADKDVRRTAQSAAIASFWKNPSPLDGQLGLKGNFIGFQKLLNDADQNEAAVTAILVQAMASNNLTLKAQYSKVPNSRNPELDWQKIQSASAQEKTDLIEKAHAILQKANTR